jgi:hypothetical protein
VGTLYPWHPTARAETPAAGSPPRA